MVTAAASSLYISLKNKRAKNAGMKKSLASDGSYVLALLEARNLQSSNVLSRWACMGMADTLTCLS